MEVTMAANGMIQIPRLFRDMDDLREGQTCNIERVGCGEYRLKVREENVESADQSGVELLLACPVKDWYVPMENEQTTDDLKPLSFD